MRGSRRRQLGAASAAVVALVTGLVVLPSTPAHAAAPTIQIARALPPEGDVGVAPVRFTVTLSEPAPADLTFTYRLLDDTASGGTSKTPGADYNNFKGATRTGKIRAGRASAFVSVPIYGDEELDGSPHEFGVQLLTPPAGYELGGQSAVLGSIGDDEFWGDETTPAFSMGSAFAFEGNSGVVKAAVAVRLNRPVEVETSVGVLVVPTSGPFERPATPGKLGDPGVDHNTIKPKELVFKPGQVKKYVTVTIAPDTAAEDDELVKLALSNPVGAGLGFSPGGGVWIVDDD
jgi:hypothetical protein